MLPYAEITDGLRNVVNVDYILIGIVFILFGSLIVSMWRPR
jgi:hypothetical protein